MLAGCGQSAASAAEKISPSAENYFSVDREDFLSGGIDRVLDEAFRSRIDEAALDEYGQCIFGGTFCEHLLAFACVGDASRAEDFRLTCISTSVPLWLGKSASYEQATP